MTIKNKLNCQQYEKLFKYAFDKCDTVMMVFRKDGFNDSEKLLLDKTLKNVKNKLGKALVKERNGAHWVFTKVGDFQLGFTEYNDPNFDNLFRILFYKIDKNVEEYILSNKNLYSWLNPKYPEDISLFCNGYCWLYSVSHEEYCEIYCDSESEYEYLKSIGIEFFDDKYIATKNTELYYEDYNINV